MLKLLLDEHISLNVANGLHRRNRAIEVRYMVEWEDGYFLGQQDSPCLQEAAVQGLTLVTYDRRTIPPLLKTWAEEGANARRRDFCGRKNNFAGGYRWFGLGLDQTNRRNSELGLDQSSLFLAALTPASM